MKNVLKLSNKAVSVVSTTMNPGHQIKPFVLSFALLATAAVLGGCIGAEPVTEDEIGASEEQVTPESVEADAVPDENVEVGSTLAEFEGQLIDLSKSWGEARACLVMEDRTECFRTKEEADARGAEMQERLRSTESDEVAPDSSSAISYCGDYVYICEHSNYGGKCLAFARRWITRNLTDYGFNDKMTSYIVGPCGVSFYEHINGKGASFYIGPGKSSPHVGFIWNDRVSSIFIN